MKSFLATIGASGHSGKKTHIAEQTVKPCLQALPGVRIASPWVHKHQVTTTIRLPYASRRAGRPALKTWQVSKGRRHRPR